MSITLISTQHCCRGARLQEKRKKERESMKTENEGGKKNPVIYWWVLVGLHYSQIFTSSLCKTYTLPPHFRCMAHESHREGLSVLLTFGFGVLRALSSGCVNVIVHVWLSSPLLLPLVVRTACPRWWPLFQPGTQNEKTCRGFPNPAKPRNYSLPQL